MEPRFARAHPSSQRCTAVRRLLGAVVAGWIVMGLAQTSAMAASKEYEVKAAFLFHFTQFVEWPDSAFADPNAPFCIGVLGDDSFGGALDEIVKDESVGRHKIVIKRSRQTADLKGCQILFISNSEKDHVAQILSSLDDSGILTVGETDGFAGQGGIINFYLEENKVRFEINPGTAKHHGLKISSQLLGLGRIVR